MPPLPHLLKGRLAVLSMAVAETMGRKGGWSADCSHHRLWLEQSPHPGGVLHPETKNRGRWGQRSQVPLHCTPHSCPRAISPTHQYR